MHKIKTLYLVLGSFAFLALACFALYFFTTRPVKINKPDVNEPAISISKEITNKPIKIAPEMEATEQPKEKPEPIVEETSPARRVITAPLVVMDINIESLDPNAKHPVIEAAFGFKMGDVFDEDDAIAQFELSSGTFLYEIKPVLPYKGIGRYYITTNTHDQTIDSVRGIESFATAEEAHKEINLLSEVITQKFDLVQTDNTFRYYKDEHGNLLLLFLKEVSANEYEVHLHCLCPN